jgi:hypothetical protein
MKFDRNRFRIKNCPCGKDNSDGKFVPYDGYEDKGYCHSCGETFLPDGPAPEIKFIPKKEIKFVDRQLLLDSRKHDCNLKSYLIGLIGLTETEALWNKYPFGSADNWKGATIFWQVDINKKIRAGKIMLYNPNTGKRVKEPINYFSWVHPEDWQACFFGEHLLNGNTKPINIVESEKTAIIASFVYPEFIWLASGGKEGLNKDKCKVLEQRDVTLYPDADGFGAWSKIARQRGYKINRLIEVKATSTERFLKIDLADMLIPIIKEKDKPPVKEIEPTEVKPLFDAFNGKLDLELCEMLASIGAKII